MQNQERAGVVTIKVAFKTSIKAMPTEEHFIMVQGQIHREDILLSTYAANTDVSKHTEQSKFTITGEEYSDPFLVTNRMSRRKIVKNPGDMKGPINHVGETGPGRTLRNRNRAHVPFKWTQNIHQEKPSFLGHKNVNEFKCISIICVFQTEDN